MAQKTYRCDACAKYRVGVTVVDQRDLCPECSRDYRALAVVLEQQDVARQTRTLAKLASVDVARARVLLLLLEINDRATRVDGLFRSTRPRPATPSPAAWRARVEREISTHRKHGKTPRREPRSESEWNALYVEFPNALYASWYVLTGKRASGA